MSTVAPATISAQEFASRVSAGDKLELIDVRTPLEFREAHISFARNIPLDQLDPITVMQARALPIMRGKKAISLERQVRIAAGSLVLLGVALAYFVHPYLIGLSAFVGAGLVFAGVTDTCGMGMMLAKMPWNNVSSDAATCATN